MQYLSVAEIAKKWNISERSVRNYCAQGRVPEAFLVGKTQDIPADAKKPERANKKKEKPVIDVIETVNHFRCIDMIIDHAKAALKEKFIKELYRDLKSGTSDSGKKKHWRIFWIFM